MTNTPSHLVHPGLVALLLLSFGYGEVSAQSIDRDRSRHHSLELGPFTAGGFVRGTYFGGDYDNPNASIGDEFDFDEAALTANFDWEGWIGRVEYRFRQAGFNYAREAWGGYVFDHGGTIKAGIVEVPFGVDTYGASLAFLEGLERYVGLADDRDLGAVYTLEYDWWTIDVAYFYSEEPNFNGDSLTSARGSFDIIPSSGSSLDNNLINPTGTFNVSPYRERNQFNLRVVRTFDTDMGSHDVGISGQYGTLESVQDGIDDGDAWAAAVHYRGIYGNWMFLGQAITYDYSNSNDEITVPVAFPPFEAPVSNSDHIVIGGFDFPLLAASSGTIASSSLSYTWFPRLDFLDFITGYVEYSRLFKDGETRSAYYIDLGDFFNSVPSGTPFRDSDQITLGAVFGWDRVLVFVDLIWGRGSPLIGNSNDQYLYGLSLNDAFNVNGTIPAPTRAFDDGYQLRFNVNATIYF